jgi:hypothetical protein
MHCHSNNDIVVKVLTQIATEEKKPYQKIKKLFAIKADHYITQRFWEALFHHLPDHPYTEIYHCPGCKQFSLE